ncbi:ribosomal protein S5 domain 2-like protein [Viridothelium virens]|uniref:Ribosomal protein S5 domain 2-like protein n=1 Tax=Viridothelium virens TaxID=1048519 RepID=A0A6A6H504_VIRVR|nr:ribosomal protein S5 domain 2-like protein [Viridothelium virens]
MNPTLGDELTSINAIFDPDTLAPSATAPISCVLRLPSRPSISLRLTFPASYPETCPYVSGILTGGDASTRKGDSIRLLEVVKNSLEKVWMPGEPCVYDLVEECEAIFTTEEESHGGHKDTTPELDIDQQIKGSYDAGTSFSQIADTHPAADGAPARLHPENVSPQWTLSEPLTVKDSTFLARAAAVASPAEARAFIAHLVGTDKRAARATHNITAWRIRVQTGPEAEAKTEVTYQDSDDDGESAAGGRVLKLMQMLDVWNVVVVVSRWFGGTLLGPERFRCIGVVARDVLVTGGFVEKGKDAQEQGKGDKAKRKGKK